MMNDVSASVLPPIPKLNDPSRGDSVVRFSLLFALFVMTLLAFGLMQGYVDVTFPQKHSVKSSIADNLTIECEGMNITEAVHCMTQYVSSIFKYNETNDNESLTLDDLRSRGGDCKDWSELYVEKFKKMGFNATMMSFYIRSDPVSGEELWHAVAQVTDGNIYCIIDQTEIVGCVGLG